MFKKYIVGFLGLGIFITVHAHNFSKSNGEIIALSKVYQRSAEELAEIQINAGCFEPLSNGSEFLSYIPLMINTDRETTKSIAKNAREHVHAATLKNCEHISDIRALDINIKNLLTEF